MAADRQLSQAELEERLSEQIGFLERSCASFDAGYESEAKRMAVTLRVLLHDTRNSKSLLGQLGQKAQPFLDTATPADPNNLIPHAGLVAVAAGPAGAEYVAPLDQVHSMNRVPFDQWWEARVFVDPQSGAALSRKELVLSAADQDGGAHVDPALNETYARFALDNAFGWQYTGQGVTRRITGEVGVALRQVAHEALKTLKPGYAKKIERQGTMMVMGASVTTVPPAGFRGHAGVPPPSNRPPVLGPPGTPYHAPPKIGRNDPCPCGSGKKYKKCHGASQ